MNFPVFDLHCDTANKLLGREFDGAGKLLSNTFHIDLERAGKLPVYCQCFACWTTPLRKIPDTLTQLGVFERQLATLLREIEENPDRIRLAYSAKQIEENRKQGIMSALLTLEGTAGFDYNTELLEDLYKIGFRIVSLCWNESNLLTGSCKTGGGLTEEGIAFVKEAQRLGMVVDVSHISDEGFWDIMDVAEKPVVATHSNSRKLWDVPRNLTDEMYLAICKTGGTAGMNLYSDFLGENPTVDTVCDHIFHFLDLAGNDRHVSLGSDFDGIERSPVGISGIEDYPVLAQRLSERGLSDQTIENIFWNNALGVIERCSM